jgi:multidrug efflux pump subunit AcrB
LALAYVPIQADRAFKPKVVEPGEPDNPFNGRIYRQYQRLLRFAIHYRWIWIVATVILLVFSVYGYRFIKQGFFPDLSYNQLSSRKSSKAQKGHRLIVCVLRLSKKIWPVWKNI